MAHWLLHGIPAEESESRAIMAQDPQSLAELGLQVRQQPPAGMPALDTHCQTGASNAPVKPSFRPWAFHVQRMVSHRSGGHFTEVHYSLWNKSQG